MCGILGFAAKDIGVDPSDFGEALDSLAHRGPDDRGVYSDSCITLGHRRLAILDLSDSGHQPMIDADSGMVIVFNGEIYNYLELKKELLACGYQFTTGTDTEVLLKAYIHWGQGCLSKLNGMWAFAVWEPKRNKLFIARDRFGIKPFYFCRPSGGGVAFASEPKAILSIFPEFRQVNHASLYRFLAEGKLYDSNSSFYNGIELLPPAYCGEYEVASDTLHLIKYWGYPERGQVSCSDTVETFLAILNDSVSIRMRSDVPVGITLSGGLDSTAVLAASMRAGDSHKMTCFTSVYGDGERGETQWARVAAQPYGITPLEVEAPKSAWIDTLEEISWHMDAPGYSPAVYPLWFLMKSARQNDVPVLLEGQGADEELGGYPQYGVLALIESLAYSIKHPSQGKAAEIKRMWNGLLATFSQRWVILWLLRELNPWAISLYRQRIGAATTLRRDFVSDVQSKSDGVFYDEPNLSYDRVTSRLLLDHSRDILPGLLHYGDAISMAHSVESRLPFMDYRLVELLFSLSSDIKISTDGQTKWVLRQYLKRMEQHAIANRVDKLGYLTPVEKWLADKNGAVPRDILLSKNSAILEYCDHARIERLINDHCKGRSGMGNHIYRLVSTEFWLQKCVLQ
jgi:asparagine synthase (glutamine-hydrolysing)